MVLNYNGTNIEICTALLDLYVELLGVGAIPTLNSMAENDKKHGIDSSDSEKTAKRVEDALCHDIRIKYGIRALDEKHDEMPPLPYKYNDIELPLDEALVELYFDALYTPITNRLIESVFYNGTSALEVVTINDITAGVEDFIKKEMLLNFRKQ